MSVLTPLLLRGLTGSARRLMVPRAQVHSKPPREQIGVVVSGTDRVLEGGGLQLARAWLRSVEGTSCSDALKP